jgi:hypothetical protein
MTNINKFIEDINLIARAQHLLKCQPTETPDVNLRVAGIMLELF